MLTAADCRTYGVCQNPFYLRLLFLEVTQDSAESAAASSTQHHIINLSIQALINLRACRFIMCQWVYRIFKLLKRNRSRYLLPQLLCLPDSALHAVLTSCMDKLRAKRPHKLLFFLGKFLRNYKDNVKALIECGKGNSDSCVPCGCLYNRAPRL